MSLIDDNEKILKEKDKTETGFRLTKEFIESEIAKGTVEYPEVTLSTGVIARWCVITLENKFSVFSSEPSLVLSPERDMPEIGRKIVYENAFNQLFKYFAFAYRSGYIK